MRETRLFTYTPAQVSEQAPSVLISIPSSPHPNDRLPTSAHSSWAGLTNQLTSWRVTDPNNILLEHIVSGASLRISFSSPICCRPLFIPSASVAPCPPSASLPISLVVACHTDDSSSILLCLQFSADLQQINASSPHVVEKLRQFIPSAVVTVIQSNAPNAFVALSDGRCLRFIVDEEAALPRLIPFSESSVSGSPDALARPTSAFQPACSTSTWSSNTAPISSFVSRLFNPLAIDRSKLPGSSFASSDTLPPWKGPTDAVLSLTRVDDSSRSLVASLHASGCVRIYLMEINNYVLQTEYFLPCKLSASQTVQHFLLSGPDVSLLAVVLADEHPKSDSLRVFQLAISDSDENLVTLSCSQLVCREGPVPPLVAAAYFAEDVVVGTRAGAVTALINTPTYIPGPTGTPLPVDSYTNVAQQSKSDEPAHAIEAQPSSRGLPSHTLWTAVEDVDALFGLGRSIDRSTSDDRDLLLKAHRFSPYSVSKALRLPNASSNSRQNVHEALLSIQLDEDDNALKRVKARAEQITKHEDLKVRDLMWDESVGLIICRERNVFVMRPLVEQEKRVHPHHETLLTCDQLTPTGPAAWILASHAVCQILGAQFHEASAGNSMTGILEFMLNLVTNVSESYSGIALTDVLFMRQAEIELTGGSMDIPSDKVSFPDVVRRCLKDLVRPGALLLNNLLSTNEMKMLEAASVHCVDEYPVSSTFSNGVVWMERFHREIGVESQVDINLQGEDNEANVDGTVSGSTMLQKAYGFFAMAAEGCQPSTYRDIICALELAGYIPPRAIAQLEEEYEKYGTNEEWKEIVVTFTEVLSDGSQQNDEIRFGDCAFWLLDRGLRIVESYAPKTAAALALMAMKYAPNKQQHERMRAAALSRFLVAGELVQAYRTILSEPFKPSSSSNEMNAPASTVVTKEEAEAMKDAIGLFINTTADRNELKWLAEQDLPEPLKMLCGQALERRARGTKVVDFNAMAKRFLQYKNQTIDESFSIGNTNKELVIRQAVDTREYEELYAWHIIREDYGNAAQCALEWAERITNEGPSLIREVVERFQNDQGVVDEIELYITLFLQWVEVKREALGCVQSALYLVPLQYRFVARSRYTLSAGHDIDTNEKNLALDNGTDISYGGGQKRGKPVVNAEWISRRLLLAHAQKVYLTDVVLQHRNGSGNLENVEHLTAESSPLLGENRSGVEWISRMIRKHLINYDRMLLCAQLCCAWRDETSDACIREVVSDATRTAMKKEMASLFGMSELRQLLGYISLTSHRKWKGRTNWTLIAMEQTLLACGGKAKCPQWLVDLAAHGHVNAHQSFRGHGGGVTGGGDLLGVTKIMLKNDRPIDAAKVLANAFDHAEVSMGKREQFFMSYTAVDATLDCLAGIKEDYEPARQYYNVLKDKLNNHMDLVEQTCHSQAAQIEDMDGDVINNNVSMQDV